MLVFTTNTSERYHRLIRRVTKNNDLIVSIQQTPYFPLWKFFLVLREFKTWNDEELDIRRI